jgi:hypothetical protein
MDPFAGFAADPMSLHKYIYAHANAVNGIDPSGYMTIQDANLAVQNLAFGAARAVSAGFRASINRATTYTTRTTRAARDLARSCFRSRSKCQLAIPILVVGSNFPNAGQHIEDAQHGRGSNLLMTPPIYTYLDRKKRRWYQRYSECGESRQVSASIQFRQLVQCAEFPFFASRQGGQENYPARVSLRLIPATENVVVGVLFAGMVSASRMQNNDHFAVVADAESPISFFIPFRKR